MGDREGERKRGIEREREGGEGDREEKVSERERVRPPVGTAVVSPDLGGCAHDDLHTRVRCVVLPRALFAVHVAEAVRVALDELVVTHDLREMGLPELHGGLKVQTLERERES